jgi:hypothetical protein
MVMSLAQYFLVFGCVFFPDGDVVLAHQVLFEDKVRLGETDDF